MHSLENALNCQRSLTDVCQTDRTSYTGCIFTNQCEYLFCQMIVWRQLSDESVRQSNAEVLACYLLAARRRVADRRVTLPLPIFFIYWQGGRID